jgi:hypothetical protein
MLLMVIPLKYHLKWLTSKPYIEVADKKIKDFTPYTIHYLERYHIGEFDVVAQYLGKADSWYSRYFAPSLLAKPRQIQRAFYYWKSTFSLSAFEKQMLQNLQVNRLYIKFFDVDWDATTRRAVPKAAISFAENPTLNFVPTVFITNRTLEKLSWGGVDELATKIVQKINLQMSPVLEKYHENELQFDCDWTLATRNKYFRLLTQIKKQLPATTKLSATIRLHQIKFYRTTGIPPVERGMLMYYNMDDWKNPKTNNSILELNVASRYANYISDYPLSLDVVLPIFSWAVLYRNNKFMTFINHLTDRDLQKRKGFLKMSNPYRYLVQKDTIFGGIALRRGDLFRIEESRYEDLKISSQMLSQEIQTQNLTFAFYHLDSLNLSRYAYSISKTNRPHEGILQIFQSFR